MRNTFESHYTYNGRNKSNGNKNKSEKKVSLTYI